jgi:deazaflavin-dependent oxidoreductase (nitroreductase family)
MAGEMRAPNGLQKRLHRFFMQQSVTALFAPWIHRVDNTLLNWTNGKLSATQILGWPIIQLTTIGAKTNQPRTMPLLGIFDQGKIALIASSLGRERNPAWFSNLQANPKCEVLFQGKKGTYLAREVEREEYVQFWQLGVSYYEGYDKYKQRAGHRHIPIMLLEPKS